MMIVYRLYRMYRCAGWTHLAALKRAWSVA